MPYRAFSTPPESIHTSNDALRHLPDHAYSPLFTTGILNSSYGYDQGRFPSHLTFQHQHPTHQTPRKANPNKTGLTSPLSSSSASPSMKKKQSSASLARSLNSSQSGSIRTPSKLAAAIDKESMRGTSKPKMEWWRGRSSSFVVANKERTSEEKPSGSKAEGWSKQSDVWMAPEVFVVRDSGTRRNDSSLGLAPSRALPGLPAVPKENIDPHPQQAPLMIKKKASFGPFKFKNFFQSNKGKEASSVVGFPKHREQPLSVLASSNRVNQPATQVYSGTASLPSNRYDRRTTFNHSHTHTQLPRPVPRPPPICTSFPRGNSSFSSPYAPTSIYDSSSSSANALPYMAGAGDGWDTPFLPYPPPAAPPSYRHTNYNNTEFPFPVTIVPSHHVEDDSMEQLLMQDDTAAGRGRVTSAAFEYQEFETDDLRNSTQLGSSVSSNNENTDRYATTTTVMDDLAHATDAHSLSLRKSQSSNGTKDTQQTTYSSKRESHVLPLSPPLQSSRQQSDHRTPVVETVKPLSIGRNYPRSRSTATNAIRSTQPLPWDTQRYVSSHAFEYTSVEEEFKENRPAWDMSQQYSDRALDSLDDTDSRSYDSPRW